MERVRHDELVVDGFAGGGGATTGIEQALGRPVDIAINHDAAALAEGVPHVIGDLGMRMLKPRELFAAQGFPADYVIDPMVNGKPVGPTKQTALAGNSVCPALARALVESNLIDYAEAAE